MQKIVGVLQPFDLKQTFYIYQDGNKKDLITCKLEQIPQSLINFAQQNNIFNIELIGPKFFSKKIATNIRDYNINNYNQKLNIKII